MQVDSGDPVARPPLRHATTELPLALSARPAALSIVATLYRSAPYIGEFCDRVTTAAHGLVGNDFEIVLVNDGSPDDSLKVALARTEWDTHLRIVDLSRNFGHHKAMMTGLAHAEADRVFLIDVDLEEKPELLSEFWQHMEDASVDVVYGIQKTRKGGAVERIGGAIFYSMFNAMSDIKIPANVCTIRLMTRRYVDALLSHEEREVVIAGLWQATGFSQMPVEIEKTPRGNTSYSFLKRFKVLADAITSFSNKPLITIFWLGLSIAICAFLYLVFLVGNWVFFSRPPSGWTSLMGSVWLIGGLLMSAIGVVGIYMAKIFNETKRRPLTIVRGIYGRRDR
jgi:putative glycosyltransferase